MTTTAPWAFAASSTSRLRSVSRLRVRRILAFFFMIFAIFPLHLRGDESVPAGAFRCGYWEMRNPVAGGDTAARVLKKGLAAPMLEEGPEAKEESQCRSMA